MEMPSPLPQALCRETVATLCRRFGVQRLEVFGSAATGAFVPGKSDFDLIVRFGPQAEVSLAHRFVGLAEALEQLLGARVDLMTDHDIANPYLRAAVNATRRTVYEHPAAEAFV